MMKTTNQRIAVVGSGISGLTAAHILSREHEVTVFEANDYIGGHTHTVSVEAAGKTYAVDTGFIVCNDRNYPNFLKLMAQLGVELQPTEMSFSVTNNLMGLEYNGHNLNTLFAQRRNLVNPAFYRFVFDILHFNKRAKQLVEDQAIPDCTLDEFVSNLRLGELFRYNYLLPMVASIWSCSVAQTKAFPLKFFLRFFHNHGLLDIANRPQWYVLKGGSHSYVEPIIKPFRQRLRLNAPVLNIEREAQQIRVVTTEGSESFDQVILACHSDQALRLSALPTKLERDILGAIPYQNNEVILHGDTRLMPKHKLAWASWNFLADPSQHKKMPKVTYLMNRLQSLDCPEPLLVSLNAGDQIQRSRVIQRFNYAHPVYSEHATRAQQRRNELCGIGRVHYCGAYWYSGFHEDGVRSALDVCKRFGLSL